MSQTTIKRFDFATAGEWDLTGDCAIAASKLGLTEPSTALAWTETNWYGLPALDGSGDAILPHYTGSPAAVAYVMLDGTTEFAKNAMLAFYAKWAAGRTGYFMVTMRDDGGPETVFMRFNGNGTLDIVGSTGTLVSSTVLPAWPQDGTTWVRIVCTIVNTACAVNIYSDAGALLFTLACVVSAPSADLSNITLRQSDANLSTLRIGGGTHDAPVYSAARTGTARLNAAAQYTLPLTLSTLDTLIPARDTTDDPTGLNDANATVLYNLYHNSAWSGWTAAPGNGDMSAVSASGGDVILVGGNLSNASGYDTPPGFVTIDLTMVCQTVEEAASMTDVLNAIKDALDADATVTAIAGWDATGCIICTNDAIGQIPLQAQAGCYVARGATVPEYQGTGKSGAVEVTPAMMWHEVDVCPAVQYPVADPSNVLVGDEGLEELTAAVWAALKTTTLSGAVKWLELGTVEPMELKASGENLYVRANRIRVRAMAGCELL